MAARAEAPQVPEVELSEDSEDKEVLDFIDRISSQFIGNYRIQPPKEDEDLEIHVRRLRRGKTYGSGSQILEDFSINQKGWTDNNGRRPTEVHIFSPEQDDLSVSATTHEFPGDADWKAGKRVRPKLSFREPYRNPNVNDPKNKAPESQGSNAAKKLTNMHKHKSFRNIP